MAKVSAGENSKKLKDGKISPYHQKSSKAVSICHQNGARILVKSYGMH